MGQESDSGFILGLTRKLTNKGLGLLEEEGCKVSRILVATGSDWRIQGPNQAEKEPRPGAGREDCCSSVSWHSLHPLPTARGPLPRERATDERKTQRCLENGFWLQYSFTSR